MNHKPGYWDKVTRLLQFVVLFVVVFAAGALFGGQYNISLAQNDQIELSDEVEEALQPLYETYNLIDRQYINVPELPELVDGAIRGMVEALDDPYSNYVDAESFPFVDDSLSGEIEGIGVVIAENEDGEIEVVNVLDGTPASREGLQVGDVFIEVNGEDAIGWTFLELASRVRGPAGTTVNLMMRREQDLINFDVERARIEIPNVEYEILSGGIGYISMAQFSSSARAQVDAAFDALNVNSLSGLIFDLRGNPGGLLSTATQIGGLFLNDQVLLIEEFGDGERRVFELEGDTVMEVFDNGEERVYATNAGNAGVRVPIVVLVDAQSASASELVAGAWQDHNAVTLIGETTFGKGTVQIQNTLMNGGGVRLTVARWLTPKGSSIHELGITPDLIVEIPEDAELAEGEDPQLEAALEFLLERQMVETD